MRCGVLRRLDDVWGRVLYNAALCGGGNLIFCQTLHEVLDKSSGKHPADDQLIHNKLVDVSN